MKINSSTKNFIEDKKHTKIKAVLGDARDKIRVEFIRAQKFHTYIIKTLDNLLINAKYVSESKPTPGEETDVDLKQLELIQGKLRETKEAINDDPLKFMNEGTGGDFQEWLKELGAMGCSSSVKLIENIIGRYNNQEELREPGGAESHLIVYLGQAHPSSPKLELSPPLAMDFPIDDPVDQVGGRLIPYDPPDPKSDPEHYPAPLRHRLPLCIVKALNEIKFALYSSMQLTLYYKMIYQEKEYGTLAKSVKQNSEALLDIMSRSPAILDKNFVNSHQHFISLCELVSGIEIALDQNVGNIGDVYEKVVDIVLRVDDRNPIMLPNLREGASEIASVFSQAEHQVAYATRSGAQESAKISLKAFSSNTTENPSIDANAFNTSLNRWKSHINYAISCIRGCIEKAAEKADPKLKTKLSMLRLRKLSKFKSRAQLPFQRAADLGERIDGVGFEQLKGLSLQDAAGVFAAAKKLVNPQKAIPVRNLPQKPPGSSKAAASAGNSPQKTLMVRPKKVAASPHKRFQ
jgi:hypothetical protein